MNIFFGFLATLFCFTALKEFGAVDANGASRKYLQKEKRGVTAEEEQGVEEVVQDMKVLAQEATGHERHTDKRPGGLVGLLKRGADTSMFRYRKSQVEEGEEEEEKRIPESPLVAKRPEVETKRPGGLVGLLKKSSESEVETKRPGGLVGLPKRAPEHERSEVETKRPGGLVGLLKRPPESEGETKRPGGLVGLLKRSPDLEMEDKRSGGLIGLLKRSALDKRPAPKGKTRQPMKRAAPKGKTRQPMKRAAPKGKARQPMKRAAPKGKTRQPMKRAAPKGKTRQPMKRATPKGKTRQPMKRAAPKGKTRQPMKKFDPGFAGKRSPHERVTAEEPITKML